MEAQSTATESEPTQAEAEAEAEPGRDPSIVERIAQTGQDRVGKISHDIVTSSVVSGAIERAAAAKARADAISTIALGRLNMPTADDVDALRSRLRTVASRTERMEATLKDLVDRLDRIEAKLDAQSGETPGAGMP
jgi:hypothetical protein